MYGYLLKCGILPYQIDELSREEFITLSALAKLNEEHEKRVIAEAIAVALGGEE